jgi:hypothetical protein
MLAFGGPMDLDERKEIAEQSLSVILPSAQCPVCNYAYESGIEELDAMYVDEPCPNCGAKGIPRVMSRANYLEVIDWIAQYAVSSKQCDHLAAVILYCALEESMLEELKIAKLKKCPNMQKELGVDISDLEAGNYRSHPTFKDIFGKNFTQLLTEAPEVLAALPEKAKVLRTKRNKFLHGKGSSNQMNASDAHQAMDLAAVLVKAYAWINNRYCI